VEADDLYFFTNQPLAQYPKRSSLRQLPSRLLVLIRGAVQMHFSATYISLELVSFTYL
jgi:hypothetical protein